MLLPPCTLPTGGVELTVADDEEGCSPPFALLAPDEELVDDVEPDRLPPPAWFGSDVVRFPASASACCVLAALVTTAVAHEAVATLTAVLSVHFAVPPLPLLCDGVNLCDSFFAPFDAEDARTGATVDEPLTFGGDFSFFMSAVAGTVALSVGADGPGTLALAVLLWVKLAIFALVTTSSFCLMTD
uniref:Uncharacterized protein n=1 Tax=Anopheles melas TaxID=34690 RepID=A0A182UH14_9DIPT